MGVHTLTLCLLASAVLVIFAAVHKDCVHNNETYKHGETVPQECMICECDDGEVKDCQQTKDCATKKRRSLPEELAKVDFLNDPEVFESSFDRKKRSIVMPKLDDNLIDNIVHGKKKTGQGAGAGNTQRLHSKTIKSYSANQMQAPAGTIPDSDANMQKRIMQELLKVDIMRKMSAKGNRDGDDESGEDDKSHRKPDSEEDESKDHKSHGKPDSKANESKKNHGSHGKSNSEGNESKENHKSHGKSGSESDESKENHKSHGKSNSESDESKENHKSHGKSDSESDESKENHKSHGKSDSESDESKENDKSHGKFDSESEESKENDKSHGTSDSEYDGENRDGNAPEDDEDEPHDMDSEPGCLFNHESLAHGDNTSLNCLDCTCNKGAINCVRNFKCPGLCSVSGFQMIRTFDGSLYTSPGGCSYILVKTDDFSVYLNNKQCKENEEAVCIDSVEVHLASFVNVKLLSDGSIQTDDGVPALPYHINDLITVRRSSSMFVEVVSSAGFALQYDFKGNRLYVSMDVSRKDTTKGLCGTFNDNRNDDYMSSNGMLETVSSLFALSWKIHQYCDERRNTPENIDRMVAASDTCDSFLDESIFADCHAIIEVTSYKTACRNSVYYGEDLGGMCSALAEYAYQCAWAGITVAFRSSFSECELNCDDSLVRATSWQLSHRDCRDYSDQLLQFPATNLLNEVCICPHDQYYDSTLETCVSGNDCPCYANSRAYKVGEMVSFPNDKECPCQRVMECSDDIPSEPQDPVRECPDGEMYSDCSNGMGKSCEKNCQNLEMVDQSCPADCVPGCICSYGSYRDDEDQCVPISDCKCVHGGDIYNPGETMVQDCNTCTCQDGRFNCTYNPCPAICNAYGESQFILFDKVWKKFHTADCTIVLAQSEVEASPAFLVMATSVRSRQLAGSFSTKNVTIQFGSTYVVMTEFGTEVVYYPSHSGRNEVNTYRAGFYTVVDFPGMLSVYFDLHLDVVLQIQPKLRGKVMGMCGDADGVTTAEFSMGNMVQYGSQFLANECPHAPPPLPPPSGPHSTYVEERCGLLKSDIFLPCHTVVPVEWYYAACVEETASCREGESCLCFCTAVAAYARACCRNGISIDWRTADTCPAPCEYYNREAGEGPYHLVNMNQLRLVADPESGLVNLSPDSDAQVLPASFMITPGLYKDVNSARRPISLESALHPNYFITQDEDGSISLQKWQASVNFRKSATFIWRKNRWIKGYDALESFSQRGRYLTAGSQNSVSISKYSRASTQAASFKLTMESFGLPFFSLCLWRYKACEPPCIKTCQDPDGSRCSLTLNVEGCFPHCAEGLVFDEETHRCVNYKDCITEPTPTPEIATTPHNECKNVICNLTSCKVGAVPHRVVPRVNPCCEETTCDCLPCADPQECGHGLIAKPEFDPETECCPSYVCVCGVCLPPQSCPDGFILETSPDKQNACCPKYDCVPASTTARTTRTPTTTPQTSTTRDSCYGVTCSVPSCPKTGQSLQIADEHDGCCTQYTCECQRCPGVTDCGFDYITKTTFDSKKDCCPSHTCVCPTCPPEPQCAPGSVLRQIFNSQMVCCHDYECESLHTTPTTTTITTPSCEHAVCERPACKRSGSHLVLVEGERADPCCPEYKCVCEKCPIPLPCASGYEQEVFSDPNHCCDQYTCRQIQITTPAPTTTRRIPTTTLPPRCSGVTCAEMTCEKEGATPDIDERDDSCCPRYVCECQNTCPPDLDCGPGVQPIKTIDIELQCCPNQKCPDKGKPNATTTPSTTTPNATNTPSTTTPDPCAHVTCAKTDCGKTGALPLLGADPCCAVCECQHCPGPQDCGFGLRAVPSFDPKTACCPTYTCECPPTCTPALECQEGYTLRSYTDAQDPCCPAYVCEAPPLTPSGTTPHAPTTPDICKTVTCEVPTCRKTGETPEMDGTRDECCEKITCVCASCEPALKCGFGHIAVEVFHPDKECCPKYHCECPSTCPPAEDCEPGYNSVERSDPHNVCCPAFDCVPETTTPTTHITTPVTTTLTPTPDLCLFVTCVPPSGCKKTGETPRQIEDGSGEDPCCPEYICECQPCPTPQICGYGYHTLESFDADKECCPNYRCVPNPETTTPTMPTTRDHCEGRTCSLPPHCSRTGETAVEQEGSGEDDCCPEYSCECGPCSAAADCQQGFRLVKSFDPETECCARYTCESICTGVTCQPPPQCEKEGETSDQVEGSGKDDNCCPEYECVCRGECHPAPVCPAGFIRRENFNPEKECCPRYICDPPCFGVTCPEPPHCKKVGEAPEKLRLEGSGEDRCCPDYECRCQQCTPPPTPQCKDGYHSKSVIDHERECCPHYICEPDHCTGVTCGQSPQCEKTGEKVVPSQDPADCCPTYDCVCDPCSAAPTCKSGYHLRESFDSDIECCPKYICEDPCHDAHCDEPPTCEKTGETAVRHEGSGEDKCCPLWECECEDECPPALICDHGFKRVKNFDPEIECCPRYTCVPPCFGVTCEPLPQCKTGETMVLQEGSGQDECCQAHECVCTPAPDCPEGFHRSKAFNPEVDNCPRYTCEPPLTTTPEPKTTIPITTRGVCEGVTCSDPPTCHKTGQTAAKHWPEGTGPDSCCPTYICECTTPCHPAETCPEGFKVVEVFNKETECCPHYYCAPPCADRTCEEPPTCTKLGEMREIMDEDECCTDYICKCSGHCPPPFCPEGYNPKALPLNPDVSCCPEYICINRCDEETCEPPPRCLRDGEILVEVEGSGSGDDQCCTEYMCECGPYAPAPVCPYGQYMRVLIDPEIECSPHYICICESCSAPPQCTAGYTRKEVADEGNVCCPRYICEPPPTTTPRPQTTSPTVTRNECLGVTCKEPPKCTKSGESAVEVEGSGDLCCKDSACECKTCSPAPVCSHGLELRTAFNPETDCCPQYFCEPPCVGITCEAPPTCPKSGAIPVEQEGSGHDECCSEYVCECRLECSPAPTCPHGYKTKRSFYPETECCPQYTCEPPCHGVTCPTPEPCTQIGAIQVTMEGSGQDECCSEHSCECQPCPPRPVCGSGYLAEELPDNSGKYCCPQFTCTPIPTTPPATTTPEFCAYVTCQDITCGPHERLVELPKPSQACCTPFECERITTIPGTTPPVPTTPERCAHVTCTVKACKPHETLVERPRAPESCCPVYECECQCDSVPRCERDERLVPVRQAHQCCPKLKCVPKKDECHPISKAVQLRDGECSATVKLQSCSGYCHSSTSYSHLWEPVPHCRCCSAKQLLSKKFQIPCPNGTKTTVLVKEAESCHCLSCSGGDESSEEQSGDSEEMQLLP